MTAFSDSERERLTQLFAAITGDADAATTLVDRVADWTSWMNLRTKDVERNFSAGLIGEVSAVAPYGLRLSASASPAERARELLDQTADSLGDFERCMGTFGHEMRRVREEAERLGAVGLVDQVDALDRDFHLAQGEQLRALGVIP